MKSMLAELKCPHCGFVEEIEIQTDVCMQFHKCGSCGNWIATPQGSCCIICSYSDKKCR